MIDRDGNDLEELIAATRRASRGVHRGDSSLDDDVAQETLLIALRGARHWAPGELRVVAQRVASTLRRQEGARRERETIYARDAILDADGQSVALESGALRVFVARLDPKSRSLVERRYFEGRTLAEIAAADGVPLPGVRTRHRRAIARLRSLILNSRSDEAKPRKVFGPLGLWRRMVARWSPIGLRMAALGGLMLAAATTILIALASDANSAAEESLSADDSRVSDDTDSWLQSSRSERVALGEAGQAATSSEPSEGASQGVEIVVRDESGRLRSDVDVLRFDGRDPRGSELVVGRTNRHGVVRVPQDEAWYYARDPVLGASLLNRLRVGEALDLRLKPYDFEVTGRVVDALGRPVPGARIEIEPPAAPLVHVSQTGRWRRESPEPVATTDTRGRFAIRCPSTRVGGRLLASLAVNRATATIAAGGDTGDLRLEPSNGADTLALRLRDANDATLTLREVWLERPPFDVEDPLAAARGLSARHLALVTDDEGTLVIPAHFEPSCRVRVGLGDGSLRVAHRTSLAALLEGKGTVVLPTDLAPASARVSGRAPEGSSVCLDCDGLARPLELAVDEFGRFEIDGLPAGRATLRGRSRGGASLEEIEIMIDPGDAISGVLLQASQPTEILVDVALPDGDLPHSLRLRGPSGQITVRRSAESADDAPTYLTPDGLGRLLAHGTGEYLVTWTNGESIAQRRIDIDGNERSVTLSLRPKAHEWLQLELGPGPPPGPATLEVFNTQGSLVWCRRARASSNLRRARVPILEDMSGLLRADVIDETGKRWSFDVER